MFALLLLGAATGSGYVFAKRLFREVKDGWEDVKAWEKYGNTPTNDLYDRDLDALSKAPASEYVLCPGGLCSIPAHLVGTDLGNALCEACSGEIDADEYRCLYPQSIFSNPVPIWLNIEQIIAQDLQDQEDIEKGLLDKEDIIFCDGYIIDRKQPDAEERAIQVFERAEERGDYNSVPLEDGGYEMIRWDWFRVKGCSRYGAAQLVQSGMKPWEWI